MADKQTQNLDPTTPTLDDVTVSFDYTSPTELKKTTWQLVRDLFKTYFDTIYQAVLVSWTNIKTVNGNTLLGSGDIVISGGGSVATDTIWDAKWDLAGWTGANTASRLAVGSNWQVLTADSAEATGLKWTNPAGWWDALTSGTLAQFASTTSAQLATVISDETGSGALVFATSPTLVTPALGTPASGTLTNCIDLPLAGLVDINTNRILGRSTAGTGAVEELNVTAIPALIGLWTSDSPQFTGVNIGHATDTSITRVSAGKIAVEWVNQGTEWILQNSQSAAYTLVLLDAGKHIYHPSADTTARTWTIPANGSVAYPIGTAVTFVNDTSAGTLTIAITTDTLVLAGAGTTGSRTLTANWIATAIKVTSTRWIISWTNLT